MVDMFAYVGETLRRLRKERGKTLEELGEEAGLGRGQLSRIENARQEATLTTLAKILESQAVSRREFFRRYDLVEAEALAIERAAGRTAGQGAEAAAQAASLQWPEEIREVLGKVESFVNMNFRQPRPVAQGAIEIGEFVVLFRVVPKDAPEARAELRETAEATEPGAPEPGTPEPPPAGRRRRGRKK